MILDKHGYNVYDINKKNERGLVQIQSWKNID